MGTSIEERFLAHVDKRQECWLWTGAKAGSNALYGYFNVVRDGVRRITPAHRVAYEMWAGVIPDGMEVDHVVARGCTSKLCVNPDHLEVVAHAENRRRGRLKVCRRGLHDLTDPESTIWDKDGNRRGCKRCSLDRAKERYHARNRR